MLVEIPDPEVILSGIVAFLIGIFGLFFYYKLKPYINVKQKSPDPAYLERLEYYERQLIDMKIRLDALDIADLGSNSSSTEEELKKIVHNLDNFFINLEVCSLVLPIVICISRDVIDLSVIRCNTLSVMSKELELGTISCF